MKENKDVLVIPTEDLLAVVYEKPYLVKILVGCDRGTREFTVIEWVDGKFYAFFNDVDIQYHTTFTDDEFVMLYEVQKVERTIEVWERVGENDTDVIGYTEPLIIKPKELTSE